jgi:hypothetical protein
MDFYPLGNFSHALAQQRRANAYELLESPFLQPAEIEKLESGFFKHDVMWWTNRLGFIPFWLLVYKGRMADRSATHTLSITRTLILFYISMQYFFLGDTLASSLLWEEYKYIYYKYEPGIRTQKINKYRKFIYK